MLYALIVFNIVTLVAFFAMTWLAFRGPALERAFWAEREDARLERTRLREDQLIQRIQAPGAAIAQTSAEHAATYSEAQPYIGAFDDESLAEYEAERDRLTAETRAMVEAVEAGR